MIEIVGPFVSPFVIKLIAAADYSLANFAIYGASNTGCADGVTPDVAEQVSRRLELVDWRKRVEEATSHNGGST